MRGDWRGGRAEAGEGVLSEARSRSVSLLSTQRFSKQLSYSGQTAISGSALLRHPPSIAAASTGWATEADGMQAGGAGWVGG